MNDPQTCTLAEAAAVLGIGRSTAYDLAARGEFPVPVLKVGGARKVSLRQLDVFINGDQAVAS